MRTRIPPSPSWHWPGAPAITCSNKCGREIFDMNDHEPPRMDRREAIKWMVAASATVSALNYSSLGAPAPAPGIGTDPNLLEPLVPWPRTLTPAQLRTVTALCDMIIPHDDKSPSASAVGVPDFLD